MRIHKTVLLFSIMINDLLLLLISITFHQIICNTLTASKPHSKYVNLLYIKLLYSIYNTDFEKGKSSKTGPYLSQNHKSRSELQFRAETKE